MYLRITDDAALRSCNLELTGLLNRDVTKCRFFNGGWYEKVVQALPGWQNLNDVSRERRG